MGEQRRARTPLLDRQRRHRRLDDGLARPAAHLRPHVHDALEVGGNVFEHLALVRADPAEFVPAAGRAYARRFVDDRFRRQMVGQGSARSKACASSSTRRRSRSPRPRPAPRCLRARACLGDPRFDIVDQQLELLDLRIELLRLAAEAGATKNGELGAQLLDHQRLGVNLGPEPRDIAAQIVRQAAQTVGIARRIRRRWRHDDADHSRARDAATISRSRLIFVATPGAQAIRGRSVCGGATVRR